MTCFCSDDRGAHGFDVAHLAHQQHIGIFTQCSAHGIGERGDIGIKFALMYQAVMIMMRMAMAVKQATRPARSVWGAEDGVVPDILVPSGVDVTGELLRWRVVKIEIAPALLVRDLICDSLAVCS